MASSQVRAVECGARMRKGVRAHWRPCTPVRVSHVLLPESLVCAHSHAPLAGGSCAAGPLPPCSASTAHCIQCDFIRASEGVNLCEEHRPQPAPALGRPRGKSSCVFVWTTKRSAGPGAYVGISVPVRYSRRTRPALRYTLWPTRTRLLLPRGRFCLKSLPQGLGLFCTQGSNPLGPHRSQLASPSQPLGSCCPRAHPARVPAARCPPAWPPGIDFTKTGVNDIAVAREDGAFEIYDIDEQGNPQQVRMGVCAW